MLQGCISSSLLFSMVAHLLTMSIIAVCFISPAVAQSISTNMPVPPLQWLNITGLTIGPPPPPLKDSAIGFDDATRSLIIFGGESPAGVPQQTTYLLNMDTLTWSIPSSKVPTMASSPPARSRALGTGDFAANSRRDFLIYGGKGSMDQAFGDVWAFNFLNQFWANVTLIGTPPSPRWGTTGGIDPEHIPTSGNNVSTIFYVAGGSDSKSPFPASDLWQLNVTGTLASDLSTIQGSWQRISMPNQLPGTAEAGGALIPQTSATQTRIAISGGCRSNADSLKANLSCNEPSTYVLTVSPGSSVRPAQCPAPRLGPALVPNLCGGSSAFASQAFILLGTFDPSEWDDGGGLSKGEVAVLDVGAGTWARVLPAGDPASKPSTFPTPREGAAALSFPSALVGQDRGSASDTIVFGGRDVSGSYLNEIWILRAYNGTINHSGVHWTGFGNGVLESGLSASGTGVTVQYLTQCAQDLRTSSAIPSSGPNPPAETNNPATSEFSKFTVSISHKLLSSLSVTLALAAAIIVRMGLPATNQPPGGVQYRLILLYVAIPTSLVAYIMGIAGFAISLTSTTPSHSITARDGTTPDTFLKTVHGQAGLAFFLGLYGIVPMLALGLWLLRRATQASNAPQVDDYSQVKYSQDTARPTGEKDTYSARRATSPARSVPEVQSSQSSVHGRRQRTQSGPGLFPGWSRDRESSENSEPGPATSKGFEVVNRPRRPSGGVALFPPRDFSHRPRADLLRSLNDLSWLDRRRSVGVVGELDYALSQLGHTSPRSVSPPVTSRPPTITMSNRPFVRTPTPPPPSSHPELDGWDILLHTLFHAFLLANCVLVLVALFSHASLAFFIVFLIWTLAFYFCLLLLAWNGRPGSSLLVTILTRLRGSPHVVEPVTALPGSPDDERSSQLFQSSIPGGNPYIYRQPPWRRAISPEEDLATGTYLGGVHPLDADDVDDDDDEDDDDRQRRMEEELERRDVNIVTVPRRKLWITNPS